MDDARRVATNTLMRIAGKSGLEEKIITWHGVRIVIKPFLTFYEYMSVINDIVDRCCDDGGAVRTELFEISTRASILSAYALIRLPTDIDELTYLLFYSDLYQTVMENVCGDQVNAVIDASMRLLSTWR